MEPLQASDTYHPRCHSIRGLEGATCGQEAAGGLRHKGVVRYYCSPCLTRWERVYDDLEIDYEVVGLELAPRPEPDPE